MIGKRKMKTFEVAVLTFLFVLGVHALDQNDVVDLEDPVQYSSDLRGQTQNVRRCDKSISELKSSGKYEENRTMSVNESSRYRRDILSKIQTASTTNLGSPSYLGSSFSQGYIDLGLRNPVDEGAASLAFVFDTTGSMSDDLLQVIDGAEKILKTVLEKFERPIHNYVLVPFHDPDVGPMTVTTNPEEFKMSLLDLKPYISGGGDCPEMAVRAIKMAIDVSLPSSYIYVFTDARAKDFYLLDDVLRLIQKKQSQVVFVMTGDCGNHTHPGYRVFESIASTSSGQIFHLDKSDVKEVLNFVQLSLESRKVNLLSLDRESEGPGEESLPLLVDETLKEFTISVAGEKPKIQIIGPQGENVSESSEAEEILALENVKIVGVKEPEPGRYNISVGSESKYTVRATGLSSINFEHGFSLQPTTNFKETYHRPRKGGSSYVVVKPGDTTEFGNLYRLQLISLDGKILEDMPLQRIFGPEPIFNGTAFLAPEEPFNLKIFGRDRNGYQFERISPTAVSSELPFPPEVTSALRVNGYFEQPAVISCHIQTLVPFTLSWQKDGIELTPPKVYPQSAEVEYIISSPTRDDEGRYTCLGTNIAGSASSSIFLDMKEPPPQIAAAVNASLPPVKAAVLSCEVTSTVEFNLTWSRYIIQGQVQDYFGNVETIGEFMSVEELDGYRVLANNSLLIEEVGTEDEGWFRCTAANEGGRRSREIHVSVQAPPEVSVVPSSVPYLAGDTVNLTCNVRGFPEPQVSWWKENNLALELHERITVHYDHTLQVLLANADDQGVYRCVATSSAGTGEDAATLTYLEAPEVITLDEEVLAGTGDTAWLQCQVGGIPRPSIRWLKDNTIEVTPMSFIQVDEGLLKIMEVQGGDAGMYTCEATNVAGTAEGHIMLRVGSAPSVIQRPADTVIEIGSSGGLSCYGVGIPEPTITWRREDGNPFPRHFTLDREGNLRINGIKIEDEGRYVCTMENQYGKVDLLATIAVSGLLAPLIAAPPDPNFTAVLDSQATLPCAVVLANPPPTLLWFYKGEPVTSQKGMIVKNDGSLSIFNVGVRHEGNYQCIATNVAGNSSQTLRLDVLVPPRAKKGRVEESVVALEGDVAKLKCPVKADPRPTFLWQKNGQSISRDARRFRTLQFGFLVITGLMAEDAGTYVCTAINAAGATKIPVVLEVHVPPTIQEDSTSYIVGEGEVVEVPCQTHGIPPPSVTWMRFDQVLMIEQTLTDGTLRFVTTAENEGQYECLVTNDAGSAKRTVTIVTMKPPEISPPGDERLMVMAGEDLKLPCEVRGYPPPEVTWKRDGQDFIIPEHLSLGPDYLLMKSVTPDSAATYACVAINSAGEAYKSFTINVQYKPVVSEELGRAEQSVVEGAYLSLPCPATANPAPTREWTKDGFNLVRNQRVRITSDGSVDVTKAVPEDSGSYRCTVSNILGEAHIDYDVKILIPPKVDLQSVPETPIVIEGDDVKINCPIDALPIPTITWLKDGLSIFSTKDRADMTHIIIENNGQTLHILEATVDDEGIYQCVAKNDAGETELLFPLEVLVTPQFKQFFHIPSITVEVGKELELDCDVSGDPEPRLSWQHDGAPLYSYVVPGSRRVFIAHVRLEDAGHYTCTATNSAGSAQRNFTITVLKAPSLEGESGGPGSSVVEAVVDTDAYLRCRVVGSPVPVISWQKDNLPLSLASGAEYQLQEEGQVLKLRKVSQASSGLYQCSAVNSVGSTFKEFNFTVMTPPAVIRRSDDDAGDGSVVKEVIVVAGREAVLYCSVEGNPAPSITWLREGRTLIPSPRFHITASDELSLTSVQPGDAGNYACLATNRAGTAEKQFDLQVIVPAKISDSFGYGAVFDTLPIQEVVVDMPFSLYCPVEGSPQPHITWSKDGESLEGLFGRIWDDRIEVGENGQRLLVSGALLSDSGNYTCHAENEGGRDSSQYEVNVLVPPLILQDAETDFYTVESNEVILECEVEGEPAPALVWLQNGITLQDLQLPDVTVENVDERKSVVKITSAAEVHAGLYTCIATSVAGSDELVYNVEVATPPRITETPFDTHLTVRVNRPATLTCHVEASPDPQIFWFKNDILLEEDHPNIHVGLTGHELKLLQVTEDFAGNYSCYAANGAGAVTLNYTLEVHVPPRLTESVDKAVFVVEGSEAEFFCPVYAVPKPSILWMKDATILQQTFTSVDPQRLVLKNVSLEDGGQYTCLATNEAGTVEQGFTLQITVPPRLLDLDSPVIEKTVIVNRGITITCFIVADPPPTISWLKDGEPLSTLATGISIDEQGRQLQINRARNTDGGNYTCQASNTAGTTNLTTLLTVLTPPAWNDDSDFEKEVVGVIGESLDLYCDVTGTPTPSILWLKNGQVLTAIENNTVFSQDDKLLSLANMQSGDDGHYTCIISNAAGTAEYDFEVTVLAPPTLTYQPETELSVLVNRAVSLECPVEGVPKPEIEWRVDDRPIRSPGQFERITGGGTQLHLLRVMSSNRGDVSCIARNAVGELITNYTLDVLKPPTIKSLPVNTRLSIEEGDLLRLSCRTEGHPTPKVAWVVPGDEVLNERNLYARGFEFEDGGATLVIPDANGSHDGHYICIASNSAGSAEDSFSVKVLLPPIIDLPEEGTFLTVVEDSPATLRCFADARPSATIRWLKDGKPLEVGRDPFIHLRKGGVELTFLRVLPHHSANYTCVAANAVGRDTINYNLEVMVPPVFLDDLEETTVDGETVGVVGSKVELQCFAFGTPTPVITWTKDEKDLHVNDRIVLDEEKQILRLEDAQKEDTGHYTCNATSFAGSATRDFVVVIHSMPRIVAPLEKDMDVVLHQPLVLRCEVESSLKADVFWMRHGRPITLYTDPNFQLKFNGHELHIRRVREGDGGDFTCVAANAAGQDTLTYTLSIQVPAVIERANIKQNRIGVAGQTMDFVCDASGSPTPSVTWSHHSSTVISPEHPRYQILNKGERLQILNLLKEDEGVVTCTAENPVGEDSLNFTLNVLVAPSLMLDAVTEVIAQEGVSVVLECPVTASPDPSIIWSVGGNVLGLSGRGNMDLSGDGQMLRIIRVGIENEGSYTCTASNPAGLIDIPIMLRVIVPPQIMSGVDREQQREGEEELVTVMEGGHASLECHLIKGSPVPTRRWHVGPNLLQPPHTVVGDGEQLVIRNAKMKDSGEYRCIAENLAGTATKMVRLMVQAPPKINTTALVPPTSVISSGEDVTGLLPPTGRPRHSSVSASIIATEGTLLILTCPVSGYPQPRRLWYRGSQAIVSSSRVVVGVGGRDLTIVDVGARDAGDYVCVAVNPAGEAQLTTSVIVIGRLEVEGEAEQDVEVVEGQRVSLECEVKLGSSRKKPWIKTQQNYTIEWKKDGIQLNRKERLEDPKPTPQLHGERADIDYYNYNYLDNTTFGDDFDINNFFNQDTSDLIFNTSPQIGLSNGNWQKPEGQNTSVWYEISRDGTKLTLPRVTQLQEGVYTCEVINEAGATRRIFRVNTLIPPDIETLEEVKSYQAAVGEPVVFECAVSGDPPPEVTWYRGSGPLVAHSRLQLLEDNHVLIITATQEGDAGEYTCLAANLAGIEEETFSLEVLVPPKVMGSREQHLDVMSGRIVRLMCEVSGNPSPDVTWSFDDAALLPSDNVIIEEDGLRINRVDIEMAGRYLCMASNSVGYAERGFTLQVTEAPFIVGSGNTEILTVVEDESVALHCVASGHPDPIISWFKEGAGVRIDDRVSVSWGGRTLLIQYVGEEDSGSYTCVASNLAGNHTRDFHIQVLRMPRLMEAPEKMVVVSGEVVSLVCVFQGNPQPKISWYYEDAPIATAESVLPSGVLQVSPVRQHHAGNYTCVADNEAGRTNHTIALHVLVPPSVEVDNTKIVVVAGSSATLKCRGQGSPPPLLTWLKGHQVIANSTDFQLDGAGSLHLPNITSAQADTYICTGRSPAGSAHTHTVLVVQEPSSIVASQEEVVVVVGQDVTLKCEVTGDPVPTVTWTRPDLANKPVTPEDPRVQISGSSLVIVAVGVEDMGRYECTSHNPAGQDTDTLLLTVHSPPSVSEDLSEVVYVVRGDTLTLGCTASGYPPPQTTWLRDGRILRPMPSLTFKNDGQLNLVAVQGSDSGVYTCLVTNPAGRLYREVAVVVQIPPRFTILPRTTQVKHGDRFELECEATGVPVPSVRWLLNGTEVEGVGPSPSGRGVLIVQRATKTDEGTYTCIADNAAGHRKAIAGIRVKVPPVIMYAPEEMTVLELNAVTLTCIAEGDPAPATVWIKEGHSVLSSDRVHLMDNGSLVIDSSLASDAGEYKCVVSNDAGAAEATAHLVVHTPPVLIRPPVSAVVEVGGTVVFDCEAEGSPEPKIQWSITPGELHRRFLRLTNGSLQLIAAQIEDEGQVICQAYNDIGEDLAKADLSVKVSGMWGSWGPWSLCSVTCGPGEQLRRRTCDSPRPQHGGDMCQGSEDIRRPCRPQPCPLDGNWSPWDHWSECSVTCGGGVRLRSRYCTDPAPLYDGRPCEGPQTEEEKCAVRDCPVSGEWGEWTSWSECSTTCNQGLRQRTRLCDSPSPAAGGADCHGEGIEVMPCSNLPCLIDGNWGSWSSWTACSASCGGGIRKRQRVCDSPTPSNGGRYCPGSDTLEDYCNLDMCPINGGWSAWSEWGSCTATCGGGQRRRFRTCDNPAPSQDGRACMGPDTDTNSCSIQKCPVNGAWSSWSEWSTCSMTCGLGMRTKRRRCNTPYPRFGGSPCPGEDRETAPCEGDACELLPTFARGTLMGELNGEDLGIVTLVANVSTLGMQRTVTANVNPLIPKHATWLTPLLSVLSPVYWTSAYEANGAANGHTLTKGFFRREAHVAFATGETVDMTHVVRGVDSSGALLVDVVMTGEVPYLPPNSLIKLQPYNEDYVQTGAGSLFASSSRTFTVGGYHLPYAWNQTISYDADLGTMPYLVQTLHANGLGSSYSNNQADLNLIVSSSIAPGSPSDACPSGFTLDESGPYCKDNDECYSSTSRCSHGCTNTVGSYACACTPGYTLGPDGYTCQDVDECSMSGVCGPGEKCSNTPGSYTCTYTCGAGFKRTDSGSDCEDINECQEEPGVCDQTCLNLIGGYRCDCRRGFRLVGESRCVDIDECSQFQSPCSHGCENTVGSFRCACPEGYTLLPNGRCKDINECAMFLHDCLEEQECRNTEGSFTCITHCPPGLTPATNGTCTDIDECAEEVSGCHFTQECTNTWGSYACSCTQGFSSAGPGRPCLDVNECQATPSPCNYRCHNLRGTYECTCAPGQQRLPDGKSCIGLQYIGEPRAQRPLRPRRPRPSSPGYPTSEFQERLLHKFYLETSCPNGFEYEDGECQDVNECARQDRCQHQCENTYGSYVCVCPPGYRLNPNQRTCDDIDECHEQNIQCGRDKLCFNLRGSYKCVATPCPPEYQRDTTTGSCILDCRWGHSSCPPGVSSAHILAFKTASLPAGIQAYQDLVRLMAYDQAGNLVPQTFFKIIENESGVPFNIRLENGRGILRTLQALRAGREYRMVVEAVSYDEVQHTVKYSTRFIVFLHISKYPY